MNTLVTLQLWVLTSMNTLSGWSHFSGELDKFFRTGLGGEGSGAIGGAILVVGFIGAGISFTVHKLNPQSRMPGWISMLLVSVFGAVLMTGMDQIFNAFKGVRDFIFKVIGI